jgi:glycosyltransferase involved in cell wall biosynthesis
VIVVGYSPKLDGGVTHVTGVLLQNFKNMELHPSLYFYSPKYKAVAYYLFGILRFLIINLRIKQRPIIHLIIGSSGDAIRIVPYIFLSKAVGLKICAQYHTSADVIFSKISTKFLSRMIKNALRRVDIHCFLSKRLKDGFNEVIPNKFLLTVIPNALGKKWIVAPVLPKKERHRDIVFFGRWSWEKGIEDLIKCMAIIKSNANCEIYTDHVPKEDFKNCKIFSWVNESEVMEIMRTAKLVVLPSYAEAYPTVLLESAACGTPFLASNIAGIPDIVEESGCGRVFEVGNIGMLAEVIDEMLGDEVKWFEMSKHGKAWVKTLSEENIKRQWLNVYGLLDKQSLTASPGCQVNRG